jgi:hypothetical protein
MVSNLILNLLDDNDESTAQKFDEVNLIGMLQEGFLVMTKVDENYYWSEGFRQIILMISSFIASGENGADKIIRGTNLVSDIFNFLCLFSPISGQNITREIYSDFMQLIQNLVKMDSDFC